MLLNKVHPICSLEARRQRVGGVVRLHAIIATNGSIKQLEAVSGDALLVQAALDAVRQWRYRPTTLEGEVVEVDTTIGVIFAPDY
jgi:protein TonB